MKQIINKQVQKYLLYCLASGLDGILTNFPLPTLDLNLKYEDFSSFNEVLKLSNNDYIITEEIFGSILSEYLTFLIDNLIDNDIIKINL